MLICVWVIEHGHPHTIYIDDTAWYTSRALIYSYTHTLIHSYTHTLIHSYTHIGIGEWSRYEMTRQPLGECEVTKVHATKRAFQPILRSEVKRQRDRGTEGWMDRGMEG